MYILNISNDDHECGQVGGFVEYDYFVFSSLEFQIDVTCLRLNLSRFADSAAAAAADE